MERIDEELRFFKGDKKKNNSGVKLEMKQDLLFKMKNSSLESQQQQNFVNQLIEIAKKQNEEIRKLKSKIDIYEGSSTSGK